MERNSHLKTDGALKATFGRNRCSGQTVEQQTLDACTPERVTQLKQAMDAIYCLHSLGYQVIGKDYSPVRAQCLAKSVVRWDDDHKVPGRQVGEIKVPATEYIRPVRCITVRCRKANGVLASYA
jgi:hypothetical protein